ncbi:OadG family protein [Oceanirhabdus sp. W0125-5]|uniref:OadG family protein n=1 Tax=Oceanirhabdus sp. W0125-5 TaxID=2999116 RepID=UPI0022F2D19E|nr:OadG family protein [Oceanirhabdus sp. W0125-5]WBW97948.1 OadG family protein [Oceanirhabdus sp. W0125-5]
MSINWISEILFSISAMAIVFGVLIILMGFINVMSVIFKEKKKVVVEEKVEQYIDETAVEEQEGDDCEVVAAIMAALSASLDVPTEKLMIRSIKRLDRSSNWRN